MTSRGGGRRLLVQGTLLAALDAHFGPDNVAGYLEWIYDRNRKLLSTMLYRALFFVLSPERLLFGVEKRWAFFRRGTTMAAQRCGPRDVELHVTSPPYLHNNMTAGRYERSAARRHRLRRCCGDARRRRAALPLPLPGGLALTAAHAVEYHIWEWSSQVFRWRRADAMPIFWHSL